MAYNAQITVAPRYQDILKTDPRYTGGLAALRMVYDPTNPAAGTAAGSRTEAIRSAIIGYGGGVPAGYQDPYGDISPETSAAAAANPHSILKELQAQYTQNVALARAQQERRGTLSSGATEGDVANEGAAYSQRSYNAAQTAGGLVTKALADYAGAGTTYAGQLQSLINDVRGALQQDPTITSTTAHYVVGSVENNGQPIYAGPDGTLYTADGSVYTPTVYPPPPPIVPSEGDKILGPGPVVT